MLLQTDLSILSKFNFEKTPVGVKFLFFKPEGIKQLDKKMPLCKMTSEAQVSEGAFYITKDNEDCFGAPALGMVEKPLFAEAGQIGVELGIFKEARANWRLYNYIPKIRTGLVNYVAFARLEKLTFDPDLLFFTATVDQAEVLFRALDHLTGRPRESKTTGVFACAWLFAYPYQTGKVNFTVTGLHFGSKAKEIFPKGLILISVPFDWIPILVHGLKEMNWELPGYKMGAEKFLEWEKEMLERIAKRSENP